MIRAGKIEERPTYFSSADGGIDYLVTPADLQNSLVYNILFEGAPLVIPDVFFFNCVPLMEHVAGFGFPLLGRALRDGHVVPAFRSNGTDSFTKSLAEIGKANVLGLERSLGSIEEYARRLDSLYLSGQKRRRLTWPEDMGGAFEAVLTEVLHRDSYPNLSEQQAAIWEEIRDWRWDVVEEGRLSTRLAGGAGIRRGEVWNALGWHLGLLDRSSAFNKPHDLLRVVDKKADRHVLSRARFFVDVVNMCYQRSQARQFSAQHNVPRGLTKGAVALLPQFTTQADGDKPPITFTTTVKLPSASALLQSDGRSLMDLRDGDEGAAYFNYRDAWVEKHREVDAENLSKAAVAYSAAISKLARGTHRDTRVAIARTAGRSVAPGVASLVGSYAALEQVVSPEFALVTASAVGTAVTAFNVIRPGPRLPRTSQELRVTAYPELTLPASS